MNSEEMFLNNKPKRRKKKIKKTGFESIQKAIKDSKKALRISQKQKPALSFSQLIITVLYSIRTQYISNSYYIDELREIFVDEMQKINPNTDVTLFDEALEALTQGKIIKQNKSLKLVTTFKEDSHAYMMAKPEINRQKINFLTNDEKIIYAVTHCNNRVCKSETAAYIKNEDEVLKKANYKNKPDFSKSKVYANPIPIIQTNQIDAESCLS